MHEDPTIVGFEKGYMYVVLTLHMEKLFPFFESVTLSSQ